MTCMCVFESLKGYESLWVYMYVCVCVCVCVCVKHTVHHRKFVMLRG